jgi:hypothetical protein
MKSIPKEPEEARKTPDEQNQVKSTDDKPEAELSPQEQMANFEESLKESDWGHQPC